MYKGIVEEIQDLKISKTSRIKHIMNTQRINERLKFHGRVLKIISTISQVKDTKFPFSR